jgi:hypothetical protein
MRSVSEYAANSDRLPHAPPGPDPLPHTLGETYGDAPSSRPRLLCGPPA